MGFCRVHRVHPAFAGLALLVACASLKPGWAQDSRNGHLLPTPPPPPLSPLPPVAAKSGNQFAWRPAMTQSLLFLGIQHGYRIGDQANTRAALKGPFVRDYFDSVAGIRGWDDGDSVLANYVGHPMQGAVTGYIQVQNDPSRRAVEFGDGSAYWRSRWRAFLFSAAYSTQYEMGPLGEAAIGNVGKTPGTKGAVDLVITPTLGVAWMVTEDALDKYLVQSFERRVRNPVARLVVRASINPSRSMANLLRGKAPWHRDSRGGVREP